MKHSERMAKNQFLLPVSQYHGHFTPENLTFNCNLQEFATRVSFIAGLHTGGKISSAEAYEKLNNLWHDLRYSKQQMKIGAGQGDGE
ncbi:MAG: hypothetical protein N5P05_002321 [Chroococcopsis gigantea SAG 12.99]|nr:hypothetical protein [Chlorogloea purpurea SAG 13.99]MDV3000715.1 hypothetical protein [Chroococcopsis gigantea SAG 12.99]